jgi:dinuclear metal center YbgI/SA1388 family protein
MPRLAEVIAAFDEWFDPRGSESWDAVGLVCGDPREPVDRVLLAIDAVPATVAEAERLGAQLLFTHHPLLLTAVHGVPADDPKGALVHRMIRGHIGHFVAHTNAEVARPGVSDALSDLFSLTEVTPLEPIQAEIGPTQRGVGRIGTLPEPIVLRDLLGQVAAVLPGTTWGIRASGDPQRVIRRMALCAGSGSSLIDAARDRGADVFLTADLKHHNAVETVTQPPDSSLTLIDASHWATERPWLDVVAARLGNRFGDTVDAVVSELVTDAWNLHSPST